MQIRPLHRWRASGDRPIYGNQKYITDQYGFTICYNNDRWKVAPFKCDEITNQTVTAAGIYTARFEHLRDAVHALEITVGEDSLCK